MRRVPSDTELVLYPREDHGFRGRVHLVDRLYRILEWFDTHIAPTRVTRQ